MRPFFINKEICSGRDVSGKVQPSLLSRFQPTCFHHGVTLKLWRPAENLNKKPQFLPTELFFYPPAPPVAGHCYCRSHMYFGWCEAQWFPKEVGHKPHGAIFRPAVWMSSESCRSMASCTVFWGLQNRRHGQKCCWRCRSDLEHEAALL